MVVLKFSFDFTSLFSFHHLFMYNVSDRIMTYAELLGNK
nr:MAG TPA: hypothetical protein [Caudoviricetes sp.]